MIAAMSLQDKSSGPRTAQPPCPFYVSSRRNLAPIAPMSLVATISFWTYGLVTSRDAINRCRC